MPLPCLKKSNVGPNRRSARFRKVCRGYFFKRCILVLVTQLVAQCAEYHTFNVGVVSSSLTEDTNLLVVYLHTYSLTGCGAYGWLDDYNLEQDDLMLLPTKCRWSLRHLYNKFRPVVEAIPQSIESMTVPMGCIDDGNRPNQEISAVLNVVTKTMQTTMQ